MLPFRKALFIETEVSAVSALLQPYMINSESTLYLAETADLSTNRLSFQQAKQVLGQTFSCVVIDATQQFPANAFAIAVGTLRAGGTLLVLLSQQQASYWLTRLRRLVQTAAKQSNDIHYGDASLLHAWQQNTLPTLHESVQLTPEQLQLQTQLLDVIQNPQPNILLLTGERGRGKSTALGYAIATLLQLDKTIVVTAPSQQHAAILLNIVKQTATDLGISNTVHFIAPDSLFATKREIDLLIVEEAAAIAQSMLRQWVMDYPHVVCTTTEQGYEGSGNGFAVTFRSFLQQQNKTWQSFTLTQPIRWAENDPLAQSCEAILLSQPVPIGSEQRSLASLPYHFLSLSPERLLADESLLVQVFNLLRLAHYRTRPSDIQAILDDKKVQLFALQHATQVIAVVWLCREGPLSTSLTQAVHSGERRLKSDLLPQSLLTYAGDNEMAQFSYHRILRIAVDERYRRMGIASQLIKQAVNHLPSTDFIGCSFSAQPDVMAFWQKNDFVPVRIGLQKDTVTGGYALLMLKACHAEANRVLQRVQQRFAQQWPIISDRFLTDFPTELHQMLEATLPNLLAEAGDLSKQDQLDIEEFAFAKRALAFSYVPLQKWLAVTSVQTKVKGLSDHEQQLLAQVFVQSLAFKDIVQQNGFTGQKALLISLREIVKRLLIVN